MITCNNISVNYAQNTTPILKNVSIELPKKRITSFIGKSGAGKTTLLKTIAQLNQQYTGSVSINGTNVTEITRQILAASVGYVFQQCNLFPHMTVLENCTLAQCTIQKKSTPNAIKKTMQTLELLGIAELADRMPAQLSGGQQQRVAIARALCLEPKCILLDEPTSALDPENATIVAKILQQLAAQGMAIAVSSQDVQFVRMVRDRTYVLDAGRIVEAWDSCSSAQIPAGTFVHAFMYR